jgi:hypothetical protein
MLHDATTQLATHGINSLPILGDRHPLCATYGSGAKVLNGFSFMVGSMMCYTLAIPQHIVAGVNLDAGQWLAGRTVMTVSRSTKAWQMRLEDIEKENPSILRVLAEETIRRLYDYEHADYPMSWLRGIEADFISAINTWAEGCLSTKGKRQALKSAIKDVIVAMRVGEIGERQSESMERIHELLVTINVINEATDYLYDVLGQEILNHAIKQVYDLKKVTEWKRRILKGSQLTEKEVAVEQDIMTEEEISAETPAAIKTVLEKRIRMVNLRLLTQAERDEVIENYSEMCEKNGFTRNTILEGGLAEAAEMLNQLFERIALCEAQESSEENL